jgi:hypothetical protein
MNAPAVSYDRTKVLIAIPSHDGRIWCECAGGLAQVMSHGRAGSMYFHVQGSCIGGIRNEIAGIFLRSRFDTLVCIDSDIGFTLTDFDLLMSGDEKIATAEYCRKSDEYKPVTFGMGFVRIHRSVFHTLDNLTDEQGCERVHSYFKDGNLERDYFRTGASSDSKWMAEDFGFWSLVHMAGITPKVEKRTRLNHWGIKCYSYQGDAEFAGAN